MKGEYQITPIAAAIVEALPDRRKVRIIKRNFKRGICPTSELFDANGIRAFYGPRFTTIDHRVKQTKETLEK